MDSDTSSEYTPGDEEDSDGRSDASNDIVPEDELLSAMENSDLVTIKLRSNKRPTKSTPPVSISTPGMREVSKDPFDILLGTSHSPPLNCDYVAQLPEIQTELPSNSGFLDVAANTAHEVDLENANFIMIGAEGEEGVLLDDTADFALNTTVISISEGASLSILKSTPTVSVIANCDQEIMVDLPALNSTSNNQFPIHEMAHSDEEVNMDFPALNSSPNVAFLADSDGGINASFPAVASAPKVSVLADPQEDIHSCSPLQESASNALIQANPQEEISTNPLQEHPLNIIEQENVVEAKKEKKNSRKAAKLKRMLGQSYIGYRRFSTEDSSNQKEKKFKVYQDVERGARKMGPPCTSEACKKYKNTRKCFSIGEEKRAKLFKEFWTWSWETKQTYVRTVVDLADPRRVRSENSKRKVSYFYHLKFDGQKHAVCKNLFLSTLGCTAEEVRYWMSTMDRMTESEVVEAKEKNDEQQSGSMEQRPKESELGETSHQVNFNEETSPDGSQSEHEGHKNGHTHGQSRRARAFRKKYAIDWLTRLPKLPSHYTRKDSKKLYLQTDFRSLAAVYHEYVKQCKNDDVGSMTLSQFRYELQNLNIGVFTPRKDQCDTCCAFKNKNIDEEDYIAHIKKKEDAQNEKKMDKEKAQGGEIHAIVCDLMKVQCLPLIRASAAYYKLKLSVHNFTIYNLGNQDVMAYWFDETNANLQATTFASFLVHYISELLQRSKKPVVIISDGCAYQHRNATLSNALLHLSMSSGMVISQKFLEVGHTYSEGDSVHARIEGSYENLDVHLTSQFVELSKKARRNPFPYRAKQIDHEFVRDYNQSMIYPSIRPGRAPGDPTVTDLRLIQYNPNGVISYKLNYSDELAPLPQRPRQVSPVSTFPPVFKRPLTITLDKYNDLQSLKPLLPNDTHAFYDSLPHDEKSQREAKRKKTLGESSNDKKCGSSKRKKID